MSSNKKIILRKKNYNSATDAVDGVVVFDNNTGNIYVGGDCFSSDIKDASLDPVTGILTLTKVDSSTITISLGSFEQLINKATSLSSASTHDQYPSAKCIYTLSKDKPEVVWQAQTVSDGKLATETDMSQTPSWQITGLDLEKYQKLKLYIRSGGTGSDTTASSVINIDLSGMNQSPFGHFIGSAVLQNPNNRNRLLAVTAAVSGDKTSIIFTRTTSLYGTSATSANTDGRVLYKVVGYPGNVAHDYQIVGPDEYTGKNFNLQAKYDGTPVNAQWVLLNGGQYATLTQYGRVDIAPGTVSQNITVQATYDIYTDQKTIEISYGSQLVISCPDIITGTSGTCVATYNNNECVPTWSIISGGSNATINEHGEITILQSGNITIQAVFNGITKTKDVEVVYKANTTQETVINLDGSVTETTTTETTDPSTGVTTTESTSTTTNVDGSTSQTTTETTTNADGSSSSSSTTTNIDGTSSESTTTTSAPDPETGSVTSNTNTTNYDENGDVSGTQTNTTTENTDGSSTSSTTNYNADGDPTDTTNKNVDSDGNNSIQNIEYDENGDPTVTGYDIDTSDSTSGEKTFNGDGVNTEFYGFDVTEGFRAHIHFTIDFANQPPNQNENHHNILTMKRATPEPWYGFQLRQSNTTKSIILGTQFSTGSNTNTTILPARNISTNVGEYDIEIIYDPTAASNNFVAKDLINDTTIYQASKVFPDLPELQYLTVCIGHALDANGDPYRYSNINVSEFSITKLSKVLDEPIITCDGMQVSITCPTSGASIYYRLNEYGSYSLYTTPIEIFTDTVVEAYSTLNGNTSEIVKETCIYDDQIEEPTISCDGEMVYINCETPSVDIYYRLNETGNFILYENPIDIYATTVVEAYSTIDGRTSEITEETCVYVPVVLAQPVITCNGQLVTITCATDRSEIYYRLNETGEFSLYTQQIPISEDTVVEAYSTYRNQTSQTVTETCEYEPTHDYSSDYLTFRVLSDGTIGWKSIGSGQAKTIQYSVNGGAWTEITATATPTTINVTSGDVVRFKGTNTSYAKDKSNYSGFEGGTAEFDVEGNIMSMVYGDNFIGNNTLTGTYNFCSMFKLSKVISAENLILPATTLTNYCYRAMFSKATLLDTPPALPATTLSTGCYYYMFEECAFTTAPDLLATTIPSQAYYAMFIGCSNLNYIKCMATSGVSTGNCTNWTQNVASSGNFVKAENVTWARSQSGIPTNWAVYDNILLLTPEISFDGEEISIDCDTPGASIYYKLNQTGGYILYTDPILINATTYVEAYSELDSQTSPVVSMNCEYVEETPYQKSNKTLSSWTYNNQTITTPYSVNRIDGHSGSYAKGTFNFETSFNLHDVNPAYLWFQHADQSASVYVDNTLVEKHWGGYTAFFVDISNYVHRGTNNIKVALKNNEGSYLAPASGDFNFNATLGNVKLFTSPYLPDMKYGYDGFHVTSTVTSSSATINVITTVPVGATIVCTITDGTYTWSDEDDSTGLEQKFTATISNPRLWNGTIDPHLYTITMEIYKDDVLYHSYSRPYGLRYYSYVINDTTVIQGQSYTGFLLNGSPYYLRGVCMHDDLAGKANALTDSDYTQEFAIIQELGCNFLRLAHYPHPKEVYDRCDQLGIIVQTEAPCVNKLQSTMPSDYYTHLDTQYTDMVNQHFNHPCIMFWGLSNETTTDDKDFGKTKIEYYTSLIKSLDTERLVGYVMSHSYNNPSSYYNNPNVDWFGCNIYVGWYIDKASNNPTSQLNTRVANIITNLQKPLAFSEYGAGGTQNCHSEDPQETTTKGNYERHDIEYQMWLHEGHIAAIRNFPQLLFTAEWQLFDIAVSSRNEGYTICPDGETVSTDDELRRLNNKGLVERDHITKKDTFYIYKAEWSSQLFVHICGKDYTRMTDRVIKCYTNAGNSASLYVNNTFIETVTVTDHIAVFTTRNFSSGDVVRVDVGTTSDTFTF